MTLAILAVLVAIVASVALSEQVALKQQIYRQDQLRARLAAQAGIQRAIEVLSDESASGTTTNLSSGGASGSNANLPGATTLQDDWATIGSTGNDRFQLRNSSFRMQILDASSRVNLNTATTQQLNGLPLLQEQIDSILDWRSTGEGARPDGAKDAYYNGLPNPYNAALHGFSTVSELLDVRNFTPADLYDAPTNQPLNGQQLPTFADGRTPTLAEVLTVDSQSPAVNQQGRTKTALSSLTQQRFRQLFGRQLGNALFNARRSTTWAQILRAAPGLNTTQFRNLLNNYYIGTSTQAGKVNVNTASAAVLQTLPGITADLATSIVNQQSTGITQLGNILNLPGLTTIRSVQNVIDNVSINSNVFVVRVIGTAGKVQVPLEAVLSVGTAQSGQAATVKILRMEEQPFNDMTGRWGWQSTTNNDITLEAGS